MTVFPDLYAVLTEKAAERFISAKFCPNTGKKVLQIQHCTPSYFAKNPCTFASRYVTQRTLAAALFTNTRLKIGMLPI